MTHQITMPDAGQTTDAATIAKWYVKVGNQVKRGDILLEVETDKALMEIESFAAGVVTELRFRVGDEVRARDVLAVIGDETDLAETERGTPVSAAKAPVSVVVETPSVSHANNTVLPLSNQPSPQAMAGEPKAAPSSSSAPGSRAMPNAKKLARELGVDLHTITPANNQFIKVSDVAAHHQKTDAAGGALEYTVLPLSNMRTVIGARMLESVQQIPSFSAMIRVDMTACSALRKSYQEVFGIKLSYNDVMAKALAVAAKKCPLLNARYENDEIRVFRHTNIGVAVEVEGGLLVPVVRNVDTLGLGEIAAANRANIESARAGKLLPGSIGGGSVTISNLGMYDISQFTAIINPPESCIFALGKIEDTPHWTGEAWKPVPVMTITASFDHRIMDGAYGAQLLTLVKKLVEQPELMLV